MKALKWIGWGVLALVALIWYFNSGESERRWWSWAIFGGWALWIAGKEWDKAHHRAIAMQEAIQRLEYKLEDLSKEIRAIGMDVMSMRRD